MAMPVKGQIEDGHEFQGGDPAEPSNWKPVVEDGWQLIGNDKADPKAWVPLSPQASTPVAADGMPMNLFVPEPAVKTVAPQSYGMQAAATVTAMGNRLGISKIAQKGLDLVGQHDAANRIVDQTQAAKENYPANYNLGTNIGSAAPFLLAPSSGMSLGAPGLVLGKGASSLISGGIAGVSNAVGKGMDVTQDNTPKSTLQTSLKDAALTTAIQYGLESALGAAGPAVSGLASKALDKTKATVSRGVNKLADVLEIGGYEIAKSSRLSDGFGVTQKLEHAANMGLLDNLPKTANESGVGPTQELYNRSKDLVESKSSQLDQLIQAKTLSDQKNSLITIPLNDVLRTAEDARKVNSFVDVTAKDLSSQFRSMVKANPQLAPYWNEAAKEFAIPADQLNSVKKEMWQASKNLLENKFPKDKAVKVGEALSYAMGKESQKALEAFGGPAVKSLNQDMAAAMEISNRTESILAKSTPGSVKNINPGRMSGAVQELSQGSGNMTQRALKAGTQLITGNNSVNSANQMIQSQAPMAMGPNLERSVPAILNFMDQNKATLPPATQVLIQQFKTLSPEEQQHAAPAAIQAIQQAHIANVAPPKSGYQSEVDGKITAPADVIAASQAVWKNGNLSIIEKAKQQRALHQAGVIPPSIVSDPTMGQGAEFTSAGNPDLKTTFWEDGSQTSSQPMVKPLPSVPMKAFTK